MKKEFPWYERPWTWPSRNHVATLYVAALLTLLLYRRFLLQFNDPYRCRALLEGGQWYDNHTWLPNGCNSESYWLGTINECAQGRKIVFVGDSSLQGTYWAMVRKTNGNIATQPPVEADLSYNPGQAELEYIWDPYLNHSQLFRYAQAYRNGWDEAPMLLIIGGGQAYAQGNDIAAYVGAVQRIAEAAPSANGRVSAEAYSREDGPGDMLFFAPAQDDLSSDQHQATGKMNDALSNLGEAGSIDVLWSFTEMTTDQTNNSVDITSYATDKVEDARADVLLGLRCNARAANTGSFPNTGTCCATWRAQTWIQVAFLCSGLLLLPTVVALDTIWPICSHNSRSLVRALGAFAVVVCLQYISDRTHIFQQVRRLPLERLNLYSMVLAVFLIGLLSVRRSKVSGTTASATTVNQPFLSRDQSDEWKGWMQALILIYHYNMAWTADWYWQIIRTCVASYLFLTGFGHTLYFLQKKDLSLRRVAAVLIRTNLLPVTLAYVMRTRWLLYYYMPLSTFWFLAVWATLAIRPAWNESTLLLVSKIVASAAFVQAFLRMEGLAEAVVKIVQIVFKMSFDANEFFHHRVKSDSYIAYVGMLAAIFYLHCKSALASDQRHTYLQRSWPALKAIAAVLSMLVLPAFWYNIHQRVHSQTSWSAIQPYITFIPILTFVIIRNCHATLRNYHSVAFAWLGKYSGEMYVMQDHLWLAGDQEAVLKTGLFRGDETVAGDRWRDLVVLTPLYLVACAVVGEATASIAKFFVAEREESKARVAETAQNEVEMGLLGNVDGDVGESVDEKRLRTQTWWAWTRSALWPASVRDRSLLVLGVLWFLNLTYT